MSVTITVDLANSTPGDIARAAKFMLLFAGFDEQTGMLSQSQVGAIVGAAHDPRSPLAAGVGGNVNVTQHMPLHPSIVAGLTQPDPVPSAVFGGPTASTYSDNSLLAVTPPVPPVAPPPPPPGIEVDAQGVPWDVRIHSGSRAKVQDGTWRQKRNLDQTVFKAVMEELRHTMNVERRAPQPPVPPAPQQVFAPVPVVPPIPVVPVVGQQPQNPPEELPGMVPPAPFVDSAVPPAPPISGMAPAGTPPPSAGAVAGASLSSGPAPTFPQLMQKITAGFHAKTISQADILRAVQAVGLTALPMLAARPDLVPAVATELGVAL